MKIFTPIVLLGVLLPFSGHTQATIPPQERARALKMATEVVNWCVYHTRWWTDRHYAFELGQEGIIKSTFEAYVVSSNFSVHQEGTRREMTIFRDCMKDHGLPLK